MNLCTYTGGEFKELQDKLGDLDIWLKRAPNGGTSFIFRKPIDSIMFKYSLPIEVEMTKVPGGKRKQTYVHLFIFWDRDKDMIDALINDLGSKEAFDPDADKFIPDMDKKNVLASNRPIKLLRRSRHKGFR